MFGCVDFSISKLVRSSVSKRLIQARRLSRRGCFLPAEETKMSCNVVQNKSSKAIAKRYARYFARRGLKYEKRYANYNLNDARVNFLRSPEDPLHGYYKQKLSDYLSQIQTNGAIVDDDDVATTPETSTQVVIEPPPGLISDDIERTARYISKMGLVVEMFLMRARANNPRYNFMWRSDPFHSFYQQKLTEYLSQSQHGDAAACQQMLTDLQEEGANQDNALAALPHLAHPQPIHLPDGLEFRRPKGMNGKEFKTMKLTAQFGAWYGNDFWLGFKNRAGFEFTNPTHSNFPRFTRFVLEYSQVLKPPQDLKEKVSKNDTYLAAIHDGFFRLLQSDFLQEMEWRLGGVVSMTDWHASLDKDFPNDKEELPPPPPGTGTGMSSPLEPEPNTQKIDEPAGLVPEEQFLAQHLGWCTIRVSVTDIDGCELLVIEKTVQSLSENVASFKEKIAEEMGIPPERQVLYCKAGLLEENNKSLAHYNVGAGEILTLSLCACGRRGDMNKACRCMEMLAEALMLSLQKYDLQNN